MPKNLLISTLKQLFNLSAEGHAPCFVQLCERVGTGPQLVSDALDQLEARGLVDAERVRLTMRGLSFAVSLGATVTPSQSSMDNLRHAA